MELIIYKFQGNEYRLTPFKIAKSKMCDYMEKEKFIMPQLLKDFNGPSDCPVKKGNFTGQYSPQPNVPPNFDGRYKLFANFYYLGELRDTFIMIGEVHHYTMA
jgi:hypothetical protein